MRQGAEALAVEEPSVCYHCGESVPDDTHYCVVISGVTRPMCCPGCQAIAGMIAGSGLGNFYDKRTAYNERPRADTTSIPDHNRVYDDPQLAGAFTTRDDDGLVTASLLLGGISCAACTWLIEKSTGAIPGVDSALVNLQQSRLDIRFDPRQVKLGELFTHIERLGYRPRPFQTSAAQQQARWQRRADLARLAIAGLGMMQVGMFAIALHAGDLQGIESRYQMLLRWVSLPVAGFVVLYSARPFFTSAWRHLRQGVLVMDLPVALAIGMAFTASAWATVTGTGQVYFDSVVMFTFLLLLGRFLEQQARQRQLFNWSDAQSSLPDAAMVRRGDQWHTVARAALQPGEIILIKAGDTVPVDALIKEGLSSVREDAFNGEYLPRSVAVGDAVFAGAINIEGALQAEVLVSYRDSRLAALQRSIEQAQTQKPRLTRMADRLASWFIAGVLLVASITALAWLQFAPDKAFWVTLSVLMVSCPCALALATPTALTSAANALRARGVMVYGENALETLSRCTHLVLDKTGTLTEGAPRIAQVKLLGDLGRERILSLAATLEQYASHPMSSAFAGIRGMDGFEGVTYRIGAGLEGSRDGVIYRAGSVQFCRELVPHFPAPPEDSLYWIGLCSDSEALGWIGLEDTLRKEARMLVEGARNLGLTVELLTGDSSGQAMQLAHALGIDQVCSGQTPHQKMAHVEKLQRAGAVVAMVGDGLNDAPVLAVADASFAVTSATDLARSQADFVLIEGDLHRIIETLRKARRCRMVVRQNFAWALGYNLCAMPLAAFGFVAPWAAAIGMSLSSLLVVANSLRLNVSRTTQE